MYDSGEFTYYVGGFSSHVGYGSWTVEEDILTLEENANSLGIASVFRFRVSDDELSYIAEGSDNFMHVKVSDGEKFTAEKLEGFPF